MIVVDTNVLSELMKSDPDAAAFRWFGRQPHSHLFTTAITMAEVLNGLDLLPAGRRRAELTAAATATFTVDFEDRILSFDADAATLFAQIAAVRRKAGRPISPFDAQIAAITRSRGAALATRNTKDFEHCGLTLINPWSA